MSRGNFHSLLRRVDERYAGRPAALERSTTGWVRLGQSVVAAWLLLLFGLAASTFVAGVVVEPPGGLFLLALGVAIALFAISQAGIFLLVEAPPPEGRALAAGEAPELASMLDSLRRDMGGRSFGEVRLSCDLNASVREVPRLGIFGWPRTSLEVGLPLLMALSPEQFRAVLAHEFVHLSARHGRGGARIFRLYLMWATLFERLQSPGAGHVRKATHWAASTFVGWYWPRLEARSLVLSRHHEFQADRLASEVAGRDAVVSSLWRLECLGPLVYERFWPDLHRTVAEIAEPPGDVMNRLRDAMLRTPSSADARRWAERALGRRTVLDDSHPSFFDRALALGRPREEILGLVFAADAPAPSAVTLLGPDLDRLTREQSERWRDQERASWRERHRRAKAEPRTNTAAAETSVVAGDGAPMVPAQVPARPHELAALWVSTREVADLRGLAAAEPMLRQLLGRAPGHAGAGALLGQRLLELGDPEEGERLLWAVADSADEQWTPAACRALEQHYRASGRVDRLRDVRDRLDRHEADVEKAQAERATIGAGDAFLPHGLPAETTAALVALLASRRDCTGAWLARKAVRHFPDRPLFVLAVRSIHGRWGIGDADRDAALVRALVPKVQLPGQVLVVSRTGSFGKLGRKVERLPGSRIHPADPEPPPVPPLRTNGEGPA
ncbi:M48 family metallopeptidase [Isosphaeraceae bacterium EP7]